MKFEFVTRATINLQPALQPMWHSPGSGSFIVVDDRAAYAVPVAPPHAPVQLASGNLAAINLPISAELYDEFAGQSWHGFTFPTRAESALAVDAAGRPIGDVLRTLVFGPDYGQYVKHPASGLFLSLKAGSIGLLRLQNNRFETIDKTKTRGRAAIAFAAHPSESLLAYGDNYGTFHTHRFDETGFGKAGKFASRERNATRVEFVDAGQMLVIGGMGYLASYLINDGRFTPGHELPIAVRDFLWLNDGQLVLVNQGMHGLGAFRHDADGFHPLATLAPGEPVQQMAVSPCCKFVAVTFQNSQGVCIYRMN